MSTKKLLGNEVTEMVSYKEENEENQNVIESLIRGLYHLFGIETLNDKQFHQALKVGRQDFRRTRLINLNLARENLDGINLSGVNLNKVNLSEASLIKAQLHRTKMVGANLDSANLKGANLSRANLKDVQASWADLRNTNLSNTVLRNANLTGADLDKSQSILEAKTMFARFDHARLPYGVVFVKYFRFFLKKL